MKVHIAIFVFVFAFASAVSTLACAFGGWMGGWVDGVCVFRPLSVLIDASFNVCWLALSVCFANENIGQIPQTRPAVFEHPSFGYVGQARLVDGRRRQGVRVPPGLSGQTPKHHGIHRSHC